MIIINGKLYSVSVWMNTNCDNYIHDHNIIIIKYKVHFSVLTNILCLSMLYLWTSSLMSIYLLYVSIFSCFGFQKKFRHSHVNLIYTGLDFLCLK